MKPKKPTLCPNCKTKLEEKKRTYECPSCKLVMFKQIEEAIILDATGSQVVPA